MEIPAKLELTNRELLGLALGTGISIAAAYLFGYWRKFGIDPLQFIGLIDVIKLTIFPLGFTALLLSIAAIVRYNLYTEGQERIFGKEPMGVAHKGTITVVCILFSAASFGLTDEPDRWLFFAVLVALVTLPISYHPKLIEKMPSVELRLLLFNAPLPFVIFAFYLGRFNAMSVIQGQNAPRVTALNRDKVNILPADLHGYVGRLGSTDFLHRYELDAVVLVPVSDSVVMTISPERKKSVIFKPAP